MPEKKHDEPYTPEDVSFDKLLSHLFKFKDSEEVTESYVRDLTKKIFADSGLGSKYQLIFLYDENNSINSWVADSIYQVISANEVNDKDVLLIIHSNGGEVEPAYLISKACKELSKKKFIVAIPRKAKSAATLISLGADEIHMGRMSELGPIDPQLRNMPVLGTQQTIETLAQLSVDFPGASSMVAQYLSNTLRPQDIGYFSRIAESAKQYAERLLDDKASILPEGKNPSVVAHALVYDYKDHGFVIDKDEATKLLGGKIVKANTDEYKLSDSIHKALSMVTTFSGLFNNTDFKLVGDVDTGYQFTRRPNESN